MNKKYFAYVTVCVALICITGGALMGFFIGGSGIGDELAALRGYVDQYYTGSEYNEEELFNAAAYAYIRALDDPYSEYYSASEYKQITQAHEGKYAGVGISIQIDENNLYHIVEVNKNGPAFRSGVQVGDILLSFNGTDLAGMPMEEFNKLTGFDEGEEVTIIVKRGETAHTYSMKSEIIQQDMASFEMLDGGIAYIIIENFYGNAATLVNEFVQKAREENCKGFIVDIRSNPGGDLSVLQSIAGCFIGNKEVLSMVYKNGEKDKYNGTGAAVSEPLVVLVNENSASASEAFAGCIQAHGRGKIVGTQTFGKGIAQQTFMLNNGSAVKLTVAKYYLPDGRCIHGEGITPDLVVELPDGVEITRENDTQLSEAIKLVADQPGSER